MLAVWRSSAVCSLLPDSPRTKSYQSSRRGNNANSSSSESLRSPLMPMRQENSFKEFIWQHVEMAFNKGFDDNVGRNPVAARFEVRPLISVLSPPVPCRGEGVWGAHQLVLPQHVYIYIFFAFAVFWWNVSHPDITVLVDWVSNFKLLICPLVMGYWRCRN